MVATITVNPKRRDCTIITRRKKVTLQGVPSNMPSITSNYNMVDQLKWTATQISLFELLLISLAHKVVLDKALQDLVIARDIDENTFQSMVGNLAASKVAFIEQDIPTKWPMHNDPLHLEAFVYQKGSKSTYRWWRWPQHMHSTFDQSFRIFWTLYWSYQENQY